MFLKGINLMISEGHACPTGQCRFIEYEDLPVYNPTAPELPSCKLPPLPTQREVDDFALKYLQKLQRLDTRVGI
jgi:hypothetical protein